MIRHLSSEQVSSWVMGERGALEAQHVRECPKCRAEVERIESLLARFGKSVRHWSDRQACVVETRLAPVGLHRSRRWVLAAAALVVLATVPAYQNARERKRAAAQAEADAILMERVDQAVSRKVPRPMEPFIELVSGGPNFTEGNEQRP
jgi:hypothetical protein